MDRLHHIDNSNASEQRESLHAYARSAFVVASGERDARFDRVRNGHESCSHLEQQNMGAARMKTLTQIEVHVLAIAEAETGIRGLELNELLELIFKDSLEYVSFIIELRSLGTLSDEAVAKAERLGDLANAITVPS